MTTPEVYFLNRFKNKKELLNDFYYQLSVNGFMTTFFNSVLNKKNGIGSSTINSKNVLSEHIPSDIFTKENYNSLGIKIVDFDYNLNQYGFRSEEFSTFNSKNINILTIGCSNSVGLGIPNEYTWSELLREKFSLNTDKEIHVYNLSVTGGNIKLLIKNIITFINIVGRPNYIFALFPNTTRYIAFNKDLNKYFNFTWFIPDHVPEFKRKEKLIKNNQFSEIQQYKYDHANNLFDIILCIHLLESICNLSNINLKWSSWNDSDSEIYKNILFKNYIDFESSLDYFVPQDYFSTLNKLNQIAVMEKKRQLDKKNINNKPFWTIALDLSHPGTYWHEQVANVFFESIKDLK